MAPIPTRFVVVFCVGLGLLVLYAARRRPRTSADYRAPYYAKKPLSDVEQVLYHRLVKALPDRVVLAQVSLAQLLGVKSGYNYYEWYNKVSRMSVDFVVCAKDATVLVAIELDDASHQRADRRVADSKKDWALESAGIRIVRLQARALPDVAAIQALVSPPAVPEIRA